MKCSAVRHSALPGDGLGGYITVLDMHDAAVAQLARSLGVRSVPAVAVNGALAACCQGVGPTEAALRAAGVGQSG